MAIDGRIASAGDRAAAVTIDPQPVAVPPDSRPLRKVRSSIPAAVRIIPEIQRHARKRARTYELADLLDDCAPLLVPGFHSGAEMAALKSAGRRRQLAIAGEEGGRKICPAADVAPPDVRASHGRELLGYVYEHIVRQARARGAAPVLVFLPQAREGGWQEETPEILAVAREAGFAVIDLSDVYEGHDIETVRLAPWDDHPNAHAHRLIAERLFAALAARRDEIFRPVRP